MAEIALAFEIGGHLSSVRDAANLVVPLGRSEEVQLVLDERSTQGKAVVVPGQVVRFGVGTLEDVVGLVPAAATAKPVDATPEIVGTTLGYQADLGTTGATKLGAVGITMNLELLQGFQRRVDQDRSVGADVLVVGTIHRDHVAGGPATRYGHVRAGQQALVLGIEVVHGHDTWHELGQLHEVAAIERQLPDLLTGDQTSDLTTDRLDDDSGGSNCHRFGDGPNFELSV